MKIDLSEFARLGATASGSLPLIAMMRVETPGRAGALRWTATGFARGRLGAPRLDLSVDGVVTLICQRCLQPMRQTLALRSRFLIAADEVTADVLDEDDDFDVLVDARDFDLDALIEDEVILALPSAPRHATCPSGTEALERAARKPSPFAVLAVLKRGGTGTEGTKGMTDAIGPEDDESS